MTSRDGVVSFEGTPPPGVADAPDPLTAVERALDAYRAPALPGLPPLHGGAVGYIGYDAVRYIEKLPQTTTDDLQMPELWLLFTGRLLVFDHLRQRLTVISNVAIGDDPARQYDEAVEAAEALVARLAETPTRGKPVSPALEAEIGDVRSNVGSETFKANVAGEGVYRGGGHLPVRRLATVRAADRARPVRRLPRAARRSIPLPYMFFLQLPGLGSVGSSPEPHVQVRGRQAIIASHRRHATARSRREEEDQALAVELLADEKERAEHVMLVDLARNDLGRVARRGRCASKS